MPAKKTASSNFAAAITRPVPPRTESTPRRAAPSGPASPAVGDLGAEELEDAVFAALWPQGPLEKDEAVRRVAEHLRVAGRVAFHRLRSDGSLYARVLAAVESAVKAGHLDRPRRGLVRACKADATAYALDDWRQALLASLGGEPTDRDDTLRVAADWARENMGLAFERLRVDGHILLGLRSALDSAIRSGEVLRHGAKAISKAPEGMRVKAAPEQAVAKRIELSMYDCDFVTHEMGTFYCVDGKIVVPWAERSNWFIGELRDGIIGQDGRRLTFEDGEEFINNIRFAWRNHRTRGCVITDATNDEVARLKGENDVEGRSHR